MERRRDTGGPSRGGNSPSSGEGQCPLGNGGPEKGKDLVKIIKLKKPIYLFAAHTSEESSQLLFYTQLLVSYKWLVSQHFRIIGGL